jgi:ribonuclease D
VTGTGGSGGAGGAGAAGGARYIATAPALTDLIAGMRRAKRVGVDTEAASFHRYRDRIYLVQVSSSTETALIDPLAIPDLAPLGALLADPQVEKVFHDADYDLRVLDRDYSFSAANLFDTRIAAQLAGEPAIGLAALLEKYVGVKLDKEHQKGDWSLRPLPQSMLAYAAADTHHLLSLRDALERRLRELGRFAWAVEEFKQLESLRWTGPAVGEDEDGYLRIKGARGLAARSLAALRELHRWREHVAEKDDKAPFRIIGNDALVAVSRALPATPADLGHIRELPSSLARRHGDALLDAVARAKRLKDEELPRPERRPRPLKDPGFDVRLERLKAVRNRVAVELGIDPGVLTGRTTLEAVVRSRPQDRAALEQIPTLRRWQIDVLGDALLKALR